MTYPDGTLLTRCVQTEELSEEDQNLKNELEMLVARLHVISLAIVSTVLI